MGRLSPPPPIAHKGRELGLLSDHERHVYGAVQDMFNAKPDLAIVLRTCFIVFEAKLTERFDEQQLRRTRSIAEVWAHLLHAALGFSGVPTFAVATLGDAADGVDLSWQEIAEVARGLYPENDRSRIALEAVERLLGARARR